MEELLDTSWNLHFTSTQSNSYTNLFSPSTNKHHLQRYFDRLPQFLASQRPQYVDDLDDRSEKLGTFRDCKYMIHPTGPDQTSPIIRICLVYQNSTFTFTLYTPHLILSKAPAAQTKHVLEFLSDTFSIATFPLKLPPALLSQILEGFVSTITDTPSNHSEPVNGLESERRAALLRAAIGQLKLTISFSGPVTPHLRSVDLSVPYETVDTLVTTSKQVSTSASQGFLLELAKHIHLQTGMKLPLSAETTVNNQFSAEPNNGEEMQDSDVNAAPLRLSKITSAGFAISVDGKLKFAGKAVENAASQEQLVTSAYFGVLNSIVKEAEDQAQAD